LPPGLRTHVKDTLEDFQELFQVSFKGHHFFSIFFTHSDTSNHVTSAPCDLHWRGRTLDRLCLVSSAVTTKTELFPAVHALHTSPTPSCLSTAHWQCPSNSSLTLLSSRSLSTPDPDNVQTYTTTAVTAVVYLS